MAGLGDYGAVTTTQRIYERTWLEYEAAEMGEGWGRLNCLLICHDTKALFPPR